MTDGMPLDPWTAAAFHEVPGGRGGAAGAPTAAQLRAFVAVATYHHFGDASAILAISQPALSQSLAALERRLGVVLVERTTRRVLLTPEGRELLPVARAALDALDAVVEAVDHDRPPLTGPVRIGVIPTVAPYLLPAILAGLAAQSPELVPAVAEEQTARLIDSIADGSVDVGLLALPLERAAASVLREIPLFDEDFVLLVPGNHRLAGAVDVPLDVLRDEPLLLLDEGHCLREQALEVCGQAGGRESDAVKATSLATVVGLVGAGLGATLLPETAVEIEARRGGLGVARFEAPAPGRRIGLVHRRSSPRSAEWDILAIRIRRIARELPVQLIDDDTELVDRRGGRFQ